MRIVRPAGAYSLGDVYTYSCSPSASFCARREEQFMCLFQWVVCRVVVWVLLRFLHRNNVCLDDPRLCQEVRHNDVSRPVRVVLDGGEGCVIH